MGRRSLLSVAVAASLTVAGAGVALAAPTALPNGCMQSGRTVTCTYASTGAEQAFIVPSGITAVQVTAVGAAGGGSFGSSGGQGGSATGALTGLTSGATLYVEVGGVGGGPGGGPGFNGGGFGPNGAGSGGGASDVRTTPRADGSSLGSRLLVAAGGGGSGISGGGGSAGAPGGGAQGGGGGAGTAQQGGAGGPGGQPGVVGRGGDGFTSGSVGGGGGGGGGLYGGGGGGEAGSSDTGGGGGGGSSLVPSGGTTGLSSAPPSVTISYTVPAAVALTVRGAGTLSATDGQRYSLSVDVRATPAGQASGRFAFSGGGAETTASSRTITAVRKTATGSVVSGTAVNAAGRTVPFTLTVVDRPDGRDQVTVQIGNRTVSGTLTNGDITTS